MLRGLELYVNGVGSSQYFGAQYLGKKQEVAAALSLCSGQYGVDFSFIYLVTMNRFNNELKDFLSVLFVNYLLNEIETIQHPSNHIRSVHLFNSNSTKQFICCTVITIVSTILVHCMP